jgi:nucleoside-diphosphate-sugar epimerase
LQAAGHEVVGFDLERGQDLADMPALLEAVTGCTAVVHAAALPSNHAGTPDQIFTTNVTGTEHVLAAARSVGAVRFVYLSSVHVFGAFSGEQHLAYFPLDDDHPRATTSDYGLSKCRGEDLCAAAARESEMTTVALRPASVCGPKQYRRITDLRRRKPVREWEPFWEYGMFVDERDVNSAVLLALEVPLPPYSAMTLCASDFSGTAPTLDLVDRLAPDVAWRDGGRERYVAEPWLALFDTTAARELLGWTPQHTWKEGTAQVRPDRRLVHRVRRKLRKG